MATSGYMLYCSFHIYDSFLLENRSLWGLIIFNTTKSEDMKVNIKIFDPITCFYIFNITFVLFISYHTLIHSTT